MRVSDIKRLINCLESLVDGVDCCAYCGANATDDEHVIPYSYVASVYSRKRKTPKGKKFVIVRSCRDCNSRAGDDVFDNFWEKKKAIAERVRIKNNKLLNSPDWTTEEMDELKGKLKIHVYTSVFNKRFTKLRLENLDKPEILGEITGYN